MYSYMVPDTDTEISWTVGLTDILGPGRQRTDSIAHSTRGFWFDGRYDSKIFGGNPIPPRFFMNFWIKAETDGTLFSTSALYDERNQHLINIGLRENRLEMGM